MIWASGARGQYRLSFPGVGHKVLIAFGIVADGTIAVRLSFEPPIAMGDGALETYRTALMNANQGTVEVRVVPARTRKGGGA